MYIKVITPLGDVESTKNEEIPLEELQEALEKVIAESGYLTVLTLSGPVILGKELLRNSMIRIKS